MKDMKTKGGFWITGKTGEMRSSRCFPNKDWNPALLHGFMVKLLI